MEKVIKPNVKMLAIGNDLVAKQMQANSGELLPAHIATLESILIIQEGACTFKMNDIDKVLKQGEALVVPAGIKHQIKANTDFKAIHFMPKEIKFEFFE